MAKAPTPDAVNPADPAPVTDSGAALRPARGRKSPQAPARAKLTPEARQALIAEAAYLRAERRGFAPGREVEDWLAAEIEIDALLRAGQSSPQ
jgi:hypothetical protein